MIGKVLKHYRIEALLGKGGMGEVYRARDLRLERPVALKLVRSDLTANAERLRRFLQEARAAAAVTHPAIAQVYDIDEVDGTTFIAMEYVEGQTVSQLIALRELDLLAAVEIALQIAEGLARAHKANIVHRDIKPENIMVTRDGHAKLLDFGLAKLLEEEKPLTGEPAREIVTHTETLMHTLSGFVMGTINYMSPEQARGQPVDQRSDIFSLGIVIYEMVTGELPFKRETPLDTMHAIAFEEVKPVTILRRNLPPQVHRIVSRCLRKRADDRYPDAQALAVDLKHLKGEIESGTQSSLSVAQKLMGWLEWLKASVPFGTTGIAVLALVLVLVGFLVFANVRWGTMAGTVVIGLLIFRYVRNRKGRMLNRFVAKVSKLKGVQAVIIKEDLVTVIVDRAQAKTYLRINSLVDGVNKRLFLGRPVSSAIKDDLTPEELQTYLRQPGVAYVRDDVFLKSGKSSD
jgi:tRNA A-37 threonylcarbamoyl transferase component Bud32